MHIVILVEDSSGKKLLEHLMPRLVGPFGEPHTWRLHGYKGIGRIPRGLAAGSDSSKRILLDQLPRLLRGFAKTPGIDAFVVVVDTDARDCVDFLAELKGLAETSGSPPGILFRLAIEEVEAWYLGDREALRMAYPRAKGSVLDSYTQDSVCGTWEVVADAVHPGGSRAIKLAGWPLVGTVKHEWADRIGPMMEPDRNISPSFGKLRDGLRRLTAMGI
jgi:hypothetical protein